ncbi:hypothetical protein [Salirhabdus sp. Marseille-P4669]|uniref:hypothetical protein n=1 Tax=Salirhabdus sp. Marseille-P4669 TaxID=2042310 RepID=UPI000C7A6702|nr:hypothetical protein [Salirhabdus sp. Marseille-P4669]
MSKLQRAPWLYLACILAGFALIHVPLKYTFLESLKQIIFVIGVVTVLVFSFVLIFIGLLALFGKR